MLAFLAEAPLVLHAWPRCGNTDSARGAAAFLTETLTLMPAHWKLRTVRADSGFFENALLTFLEARAIPCFVVARITQTVKRKTARATQRGSSSGKIILEQSRRLTRNHST